MHRDLPLFLDVPLPRAEPRVARDPVDRVLRRIHPRLAAAWRQDRDVVRRIPVAGAVPALLALGGFVVFGVMRTGIVDLFTESIPLLVLAAIVGMLSPTVGLLLVVGIGVTDALDAVPSIIDTANEKWDPSSPIGWWPLIPGLAGRLVTYIALWILVVEISLIARQTATSRPLVWVSKQSRGVAPIALGVVAGLTASLLVLLWTAAVPFVLRAPFMWANWAQPSATAIFPVQSNGWPIVVAAGLAAAVAMALISFLLRGAATDSADEGSVRRGHLSWIAPRLVALLLLGAILSSILDVAMLVAALFAGPFLAQRVWALPRVPDALEVVPGLVRFLAAYGVTVLIGQAIATPTFEGFPASPFFPVIATIGVGILLLDVVFGPPSALNPSATHPRASALAAAVVVLAATATFLLAPAVALADDCGGPSDCYSDPILLSTAAAAAAAGAAGNRRRPHPKYPDPLDPGHRKKWPQKELPTLGPPKYDPRYDPNLYDPDTDTYRPQPVFATSGTGTKA